MGFGLELRGELAGQEPGMVVQLDDLHEVSIRVAVSDFQVLFLQRCFEVGVELVAMPVSLGDWFVW